MNHPIAQAVALVCHANAALRGGGRIGFPRTHSTAQFCEWIRFVSSRWSFSGALQVAIADEPEAWFAALRAAGRRRLLLVPSQPLRVVGSWTLGPAGAWGIRARGGSTRDEVWSSRWDRGGDAVDRRIWRVTYVAVRAWRWPALASPPRLDAVRQRLTAALTPVRAFAERHGCGMFADAFAAALRMLDTGRADDVYHRDLAPPGCLPDEAEVLLAACQKAWVFGGMGSWNDLAFGAAQGEYERLTRALLAAVEGAIAAGANASAAADA